MARVRDRYHRLTDELRRLSKHADREDVAQVLVDTDAAMERGEDPKAVRSRYAPVLDEAEIDEEMATALDLFAENTGAIHNQRVSIIENLKKKIAKGTYDPSLAWKLWMFWYDQAARHYARENGNASGAWAAGWIRAHLPTPLRRVLAKRRAVQEHAAILAGEHGPLPAAPRSRSRR